MISSFKNWQEKILSSFCSNPVLMKMPQFHSMGLSLQLSGNFINQRCRTMLGLWSNLYVRSYTDSPFVNRHVGSYFSKKDAAEMLKCVGVHNVEALINQTIPASIRLPAWEQEPDDHGIPTQSTSEDEIIQNLQSLACLNQVFKSYIGMGYYDCILPTVIRRHLFENATWYSAYTPYQAEISQGRLESLLNFQTIVTELTGMDVANASLLDEASAAAEAMKMVHRASHDNQSTFLASDRLHPQIIDVLRTHASSSKIELVVGNHNDIDYSKIQNLCGVLVQYPNTFGFLEDFTKLGNTIHEVHAQLIVVADPLALCIAKPPSVFGADIVVGSMQRFGVPMGFGGPHAAYFATSKSNVRRMPGRIIGITIDSDNNQAYRMTLQTREQHIRKDKATSNICTAQALLANVAAMYGVFHGPHGLQKIARRVHFLASLLQTGLETLGYKTLENCNFFDTLAIETNPIEAREITELMENRFINVRSISDRMIGISLDETTTIEDVKILLGVFAEAQGLSATNVLPFDENRNDGSLPENFRRTTPFMQQDCFNKIHTETEMMRYIKHLEKKDLGLNTSMISLGSCTMKLNPTASLLPILAPEWANVHPFAPNSQTKGYQSLIFELCSYLSFITGFDGVSLQPNSGATGEYAGLMTIRKYQDSIGEGHRNLCIIPKSAHGTNPASAVMAGFKILPIESDSKGTICLDQLEKMAKENANNLSTLMITYPSTLGIFEENIIEICEIIHRYGGSVYMDGANMNAQLGLTSPGFIGADVCHLNLHKTFAIPHGGGGPGVGPICVKKHLIPFLPSHSIVKPRHDVSGPSVAAAPFGSAMILPISWMFIRMLGLEGLKASAQFAILNANYMMTRLQPYFNMKFTGKHGRCAHEFILDVEPFKKSCGIVEEDIAKRLMDYGFHAPTMSWPIPSSLMIEPTESESKAELDRFCDSMIAIREEIRKIENGEWPADNNPLKNAPHSELQVVATNWNRPYSREVAAFPLPWIARRGKFWPSVSRINNAYGERNLFCTCGDVSDYA